jgi:hypothetical protein
MYNNDETKSALTSKQIFDEPLTVEQMYHNILRKSKMEGCGKFQFIVFLTVVSGLSGFGYLEYGVGYYELFPQFDCTIGGEPVVDCSAEQICQGTNTAQIPYTVNYNNHTSLHNWVEQIDLVCAPSLKLSLIGSMFFAGWAATVLFVPLLADKIGRKWIFFFSVLLTWIVFGSFLASKSITTTIVL